MCAKKALKPLSKIDFIDNAYILISLIIQLVANGIRAVHVTSSLELDSGLWYIRKYWITFYNVNSVINI